MDELYVMETHLQEPLAAADILFLAPVDHSRHMIDVFRLYSLSAICDHALADPMHADAADCKLKDEEFIEVICIIDALGNKTKSIHETKRDFLMLLSSMNGTKANVMEGIANLLTKLPHHEIYNQDKIGELNCKPSIMIPSCRKSWLTKRKTLLCAGRISLWTMTLIFGLTPLFPPSSCMTWPSSWFW
ncbi:hypothetical protein RMATCC62417_16336 [Rhizopus microsporus]|nr:hypothetical protein RMATCC62417_16336 [Rhizopus microsporus]